MELGLRIQHMSPIKLHARRGTKNYLMRYFTLLLFMLAFITATPTANAFVIVTPGDEVTTTEAEALAAVAEYKAELAAMSKKERRQLRRDQRKQAKQLMKEYKNGEADVEEGSLLLIILAILLPPLAVFLYEGAINTKFWISLVLTLLFFLPGIIYALLVITGNAKK